MLYTILYLEIKMHTIESSIILSIILLTLSSFIVFSMKFEMKINKNISIKIENAIKEYSLSGDRKFKPDKIQRIITNIENIIGGENE